jgi:hypothetical protein
VTEQLVEKVQYMEVYSKVGARCVRPMANESRVSMQQGLAPLLPLVEISHEFVTPAAVHAPLLTLAPATAMSILLYNQYLFDPGNTLFRLIPHRIPELNTYFLRYPPLSSLSALQSSAPIHHSIVLDRTV